jgi:hypothetical protein
LWIFLTCSLSAVTDSLKLGNRLGWVVSITLRPCFTPGERTPVTHCTGGWVGPRAGLDAETRRKILCLCWGSNLGRPVRSQSKLTELSGSHPLCNKCNNYIEVEYSSLLR